MIGDNEKENRNADLPEKNFSPVKKRCSHLCGSDNDEKKRVSSATLARTLDRECSAGHWSNRGGWVEASLLEDFGGVTRAVEIASVGSRIANNAASHR